MSILVQTPPTLAQLRAASTPLQVAHSTPSAHCLQRQLDTSPQVATPVVDPCSLPLAQLHAIPRMTMLAQAWTHARRMAVSSHCQDACRNALCLPQRQLATPLVPALAQDWHPSAGSLARVATQALPWLLVALPVAPSVSLAAPPFQSAHCQPLEHQATQQQAATQEGLTHMASLKASALCLALRATLVQLHALARLMAPTSRWRAAQG
mmetsp:Transcript_31740/g.72434  ORF Transcript_31740/g.72434 Transcript_31740/m.72434 type:complete len:209 (-) Transcript_31740:303-929(-)